MHKWRILTKDFTLPFTLSELKTKANFSDHFLSVSYCVDKIIQIMIPGEKGGAIMGYQVLNRENKKNLKMFFSSRILPTT